VIHPYETNYSENAERLSLVKKSSANDTKTANDSIRNIELVMISGDMQARLLTDRVQSGSKNALHRDDQSRRWLNPGQFVNYFLHARRVFCDNL
jgi:hypothetical protein